MTDRTVRVRVLAEFPGYGAQMSRAAGQTTAFGRTATLAGRGVRMLGADAAAARGGLLAAGAGARGGAAGLREAEVAAAMSGRSVRAVGAAAAGTVPVFGRVGAAARSGLGAVRGGAAAALAPVKSLGLLLAGGALIYGLHDIVHEGNEYTNSMYKFLEVTRASGAEMQSAGREAQALGSDMKLPSANAAEAADAMVDLAKAGLGAQDAIKAARGTIQLSAAARTDVATAAKIEGDIMDQFALKAGSATHVADVLANTTNSASGELMDLYYAMKYVGPTAHSLGVSLDDVATAVGLLGKSGIIGETAGTSLRGALVNLAKQTPQMRKGLKSLGIEAFDTKGRFKGLEYVISTLHDAQERLTQQQFTQAAAMAFGKPALSAMTALAHQGGEAFEQYGKQVGRAGGAAAIAAAESKGLGGAMRGLGKQVSSTFLQVYLGISPVLEGITRRMTSSVSHAIPYIKRGVRTAGDLWTLYGPTVEAHLGGAEAGISRAAHGLANAVGQALAGGAITSFPVIVTSVHSLETGLHNAAGAARPLESGLHDVADSVSGGSGALQVLAGRLQVVVGWAGGATAALGPIGHAVGALAHDFAALPGPIQLSVLSMLALRPFRGQITGMQNAVTGFGRRGVASFRSFGDEIRLQRTLARSTGLELTRMGGAAAALQARSRTFNEMGTAFRTTAASIRMSRGPLAAFRGQITGMQTAVVGFGRRGVASFRLVGDEVRLQQTLARNAGLELGRMGGTVAALQSRVRSTGGFRSFSSEVRLQQTLARGTGRELGRMGGAVAALQARVRGTGGFRSFGNEIRLQQTLARGTGRELGRMGGTVAALQSRVRVAGAGLSSFRGVVGGTAAALGVGAGRGLLGAGRGLVSFLGGPWGVAFGAAMIGLDLFAKHQQKAAQATQEMHQRVSGLTQALVESNGVINANVRAQALQELESKKVGGTTDNLVVAMRKAGIGSKELVSAYTGQGGSLAAMRKNLAAVIEAHKGNPMGKTFQNAMNLSQALDAVSGDYKKAVDGVSDYKSAVDNAQNPTGRLSDAIAILADGTQDAATRASALHTALQLLSGGELDTQAAVAEMNRSLLDLNGTWQEGVDRTKGYKQQLLQVDGSLNTTSENGQTLWNKLQSLNEATAGAAQSTYDLARANGTAVVPALEQAEARMQTAWKTAVTAGIKFGLTAEQAQLMVAQMGFIPSSLAITMSTPGLDQTAKDLLYVDGLAGHLPKDAKVKVTALTADATREIERLGFKVHTLPGGRQMEITAPTEKAARALDELIAKRIPGKRMEVDAATARAATELEGIEKKLRGVPAGKRITITAPSAMAIADLRTIGLHVKSLPGHRIAVTVPTSSVKSAVDLIKEYLASIQDKHIVLTTENRTINTGKGGRGANASADGNILTAYSGGGMREKHIAQIATGGSMRLWGEPETGGEAYIPLSPAKRSRSTAILRQVARDFGYDLQHFAEGGIKAYAGGGLSGFTYAPTEPAATLGGPGAGMDRYANAVQRLTDAWAKLTDALAEAAKKSGAVRDAEKNLDQVRSGHHTAKQLAAAEKKLRDARAASAKADAAVRGDRNSVYSADSALGLRKGAKAPKGFDLGAYAQQLANAQKANHAWESNLRAIGKKAGGDVEATLRDMGESGQDLVAALAHSSGKQFQNIVNNLKSLAPTAKATLADYTNQLKKSASTSKAFQADLLKLASMGYGDLASQLAAQGDDNAAAVAAAAANSPKQAAAANSAAKAAANTLSPDDLTNALALIGVLRARPHRGIADVIAAGLDWGTIQALVPKIGKQLAGLPKADTDVFLKQVASQGPSAAMARGGILDRPTNVLAAEAGDTESWIPWNGSARSRHLLAQTAGAFGYHLTPIGRPSGAQVHYHTTNKHYETHLHGAGMSTAEQTADVARRIAFVG